MANQSQKFVKKLSYLPSWNSWCVCPNLSFCRVWFSPLTDRSNHKRLYTDTTTTAPAPTSSAQRPGTSALLCPRSPLPRWTCNSPIPISILSRQSRLSSLQSYLRSILLNIVMNPVHSAHQIPNYLNHLRSVQKVCILTRIPLSKEWTYRFIQFRIFIIN